MQPLRISGSGSVPDSNTPYPTEESRCYVPQDRVVGEGPTAQRNIFGKRLSECTDLSLFEKTQLAEFDKKCESSDDTIGGEDTQKLRFLQGCSWNIENALRSYHEYISWKTTVTFDFRQLEKSYSAAYWYGHDKCQRPILYMHCNELLAFRNSQTTAGGISQLLLTHIQFFVQELSVPDHVEQLVTIVDLKDFPLWEAPVGEFKILASTLSSYFRARLNKVFLINTPFVFYGLWQAIQVFIPERTLAKIIILSTDYVSNLLHQIDIDKLSPRIVLATE